MKKKKPPHLVLVATFTTITIIFGVFYSIYNIIKSTPSSDVPEELLNPISPSLDIDSLNKLKGRVFFEDQEIESVANLKPAINPEPEEKERIASPTATVIPLP